jgi:rare lipoprotein A
VAEAAEAAGRCGTAVWFAETGGLTASGERDKPGALSAAHRSLPFGTNVRVENLRNGRSVVVRVNDRGPKNRIISVSSAAADKLGMKSKGIAKVRLTVIDRDNPADAACDAVAVSAEGTTSVDAAIEVAKSAGAEAVVEPAAPAAALAYAEAGGDLPTEDAEPAVATAPEAVVETIPPEAVRGMMTERFDIAFQPESWQDVELRRAIEAILPRYFNVAPVEVAPQPAEVVAEPVALTPEPAEPAPQPVEVVAQPVALTTEPVEAAPPPVAPSPPPVELAAEPVKAVQERVEPAPQPIEPVPEDMLFSRRLAENWSFPGAEAAEPAIDLSPPTVVTAP